MTKYRITKRIEETECDECGYPLFTDDTAYMSDDERHVYCSKACAGEEVGAQAQPARVDCNGWSI